MSDFLLTIIQKLYLQLTTLEKNFFDTFYFLKHRPKAKVISIGNLSMGGTGKTPILFELLNEMNEADTAVISRGYKSPWERSFYLVYGNKDHPQELTDEALLLNRKFPNIPLFLGKNRHHSAIMAENRFPLKTILLDDGFQYRRLCKDIDIIVWDAMSELEEAQLLPKGRLREPIKRLKDASAILLTRCETAGKVKVAKWREWLKIKSNNTPTIMLETVISGFINTHGNTVNPNQKCLAFAAIGRPESFFTQLENSGVEIINKVIFRDHHRFTNKELTDLIRTAQNKNLQIICTEKDLIKISKDFAISNNIIALQIRVIPVSGKTLLQELQCNNVF